MDLVFFFFFFFNDTATTEIYTLSLHDALPISWRAAGDPHTGGARGDPPPGERGVPPRVVRRDRHAGRRDRKSTRLNSSHGYISYAVFCLKKKKQNKHQNTTKRSNRIERRQ